MSNQISSSKGRARQKGQGLVEFALISPILLMAMMAIMDFSHVIVTYVQAVGALREAVRYAEVVGYVANGSETPRYLDCDGMETSARQVILVDAHDVTINYMKQDGVTTYTCDTVSSGVLDSGDMLQITSSARVDLLKPSVMSLMMVR